MDIALLNVKITFQKNAVMADEIGNHISSWADYYTCHATVSGEGGAKLAEHLTAGQIVDDSELAFTVRYCNALKKIDSLNYRIVFDGVLYNIVSIDHMSYKKKCLKFRCKKVRR